jgi:hypothetical protein
METIRFTDEIESEKGLRIIMASGPVVYTGDKGEYKVPDYILALLDEQKVGYEVLNHQHDDVTQKN